MTVKKVLLTKVFMDAHEALAFGLVNHVVKHNELMQVTRQLALDIVGNEQDGVRRIRQTYAEHNAETSAWEHEGRVGTQWRREQFTPEKVAERRARIMERGRGQ
jgi:enoyl-CoA hydratase